jgi:hypothetical protein
VPLRANGSDGLFTIRLGGADSFGGVAPDTVGTYTFTTTCPSGGGSTEFEFFVQTPTVPLTAGMSVDGCATSDVDLLAPLGTYADLCYDFTNPLGPIVGFAGRVLSVRQAPNGDQGTSFTYPGQSGSPALPGGGSYSTQPGFGPVVEAETLGVYIVLDDGGGNFAVSDIVQLTVEPTPALAVTVTSGLTAGQSCPENGGLVERTVDAGTDVYFCYSVELLSELDVDDHTIDSSVQGIVGEDLAEPLSGLGATFEYGVATPVRIDATTVNTATWTAFDTSDTLPTDLAVVGTGSGTVLVTSPDGPVVPPPTSPPPPAAAVVTEARFTG